MVEREISPRNLSLLNANTAISDCDILLRRGNWSTTYTLRTQNIHFTAGRNWINRCLLYQVLLEWAKINTVFHSLLFTSHVSPDCKVRHVCIGYVTILVN